MRIIRVTIRILLAFLLFFIILGVLVIAPVDRSDLSTYKEVSDTYTRLENLERDSVIYDTTKILKAGWAKSNISPEIPLNMAGYGRRGSYTGIHDSLYARVVVVDDGKKEIAIISLDLVMFPKILTEILPEKLKRKFNKEDLYFSAIHTHNGYGGWDKTPGGQLLLGWYNEDQVEYISNQIISAIEWAQRSKKEVKLGYYKTDISELILHRLNHEHGITDNFARTIVFEKENGSKALITSFAGHPVNLYSENLELSRDYPGVVVDNLEKHPQIDFAMFCAGMVGSHNIRCSDKKDYKRLNKIGGIISNKLINQLDTVRYIDHPGISTQIFNVSMPPSQLRLTKNLRIRDWAFRKALGPLEADIRIMKLGNILMLGMPCDYSGELVVSPGIEEEANMRGLNLFITSFNGNYIGYITADHYYDTRDHEEVTEMNWVGPYKGAYFTRITEDIVNKF